MSAIVLSGACGQESAERHITATTELMNALPLGPGDVVSLIDAVEARVSDQEDRAEPCRFPALTSREHDARRAEFKARLEPLRTVRKAKVVPYNLEKQRTL